MSVLQSQQMDLLILMLIVSFQPMFMSNSHQLRHFMWVNLTLPRHLQGDIKGFVAVYSEERHILQLLYSLLQMRPCSSYLAGSFPAFSWTSWLNRYLVLPIFTISPSPTSVQSLMNLHRYLLSSQRGNFITNLFSTLDISHCKLKFVLSIDPSPSPFLPGADLRLIWTCSPSYSEASIDLSMQFSLSIGSKVSRCGQDLMWKILKIRVRLQRASLGSGVGKVKTASGCATTAKVIRAIPHLNISKFQAKKQNKQKEEGDC